MNPGVIDGKQCPPHEAWTELAAGSLMGEEAEQLILHAATCDRCAECLRHAVLILDGVSLRAGVESEENASSNRDLARRMAGKSVRSRWKWSLYLTAAAASLALVFWLIPRAEYRHAPNQLIARAYTAARPFKYWMPDDGYSSVRQQRGPTSQFDKPAPLIEAEVTARNMVAVHPDDPRALEFKGQVQLLDLEYGPAIDSLTRAREQLPEDVSILASLATAYAARGGGPDLMHAVELYLQALKRDPSNVRIWFNLALVYDKQSMIDQAVEACQKVLNSTVSARWRQEANDLLNTLREKQNLKKKADARVLKDPVRFIARYGTGNTFDCLDYVEPFWSEWLPHAEVGPTHHAASLVAANMKVQFGDPSLESTLARVTSRRSWVAVRLLADSISYNRTGKAQKSLDTARRAVAALEQEGLLPAANRARVELAYALRWAGRYGECLAVTDRVKHLTAGNQGWLLNQARLEHSSCSAGLGKFDQARAEIQQSYEETSKMGLWPVALRAAGFLTAIDAYTGNYTPIWFSAYRGLSTYWNSSASLYRAQNFQFDLYKAAKFEGWREAALVFYRAVKDCSRAAGNHEMEARDRFGIAGLLHEAGELQAEIQELQIADQLVREMDGQSDVVANLQWEARLRKAEAQAGNNSNEALSNLQGLEDRMSHRTLSQQMRLWQTRGLALATKSQLRAAAVAFQKSIVLNQNDARSVRSWVERIPILDLAAPSYRGLTQIELETLSDPAAALNTWLQYRTDAKFTSGLTVTMAQLPRGIAVWRTEHGATTVRWVPDAIDTILRMSETLRRLCSSPDSDERQIRNIGARLYRALLGPELLSVSPGIIRINADSWLSAIPFAALTNENGTYLGKKWSFVESYGPMALSRTTVDLRIDRPSRALVIAAPSGRIPGGGEMPVLTAAMPEAQDVASHFSSGILKVSPGAESLKDLAINVELFHFVGHGWANDEGGALLLQSSAMGDGFLTARELAAQDWSKCRLAVLSACLTATGIERGMANNQSLVQALLGGGALRVVASRWSIDSEATRCLMGEFYDALLHGVSVPQALTVGANAVSERELWKHPYYWAAFDVFGTSG